MRAILIVLALATAAGVVCMVVSFFRSRAAAGALVVAAAGLLVVFAIFVGSGGVVTWDRVAAMAAYGLSLIAAVMVLVERKGNVCESSSSEPGPRAGVISGATDSCGSRPSSKMATRVVAVRRAYLNFCPAERRSSHA